MAGYVSSFATGATIEAILNKANNSQSVSIAEKTAWNNKQNALTFDTTPTVESSNPVTSDGIYNYIESKIQYATTDILWNDSNGAAVGTEYTMNGNIDDYDVIVLKVSDPGDVSQFDTYEQYPFAVSMIGTDEQINCLGYGFRYLSASIHSDKVTVTRAGTSGEGDQYIPILWEIVGIKFGTGTNTSTGVKTLTYTGDGSATTTITFPETPTVILSIDGPGTGTGMVNLSSFRFGAKAVSGSWSDTQATGTKANGIFLLADTNNNTLLLSGGQNVGSRCNVADATYTVTYI